MANSFVTRRHQISMSRIFVFTNRVFFIGLVPEVFLLLITGTDGSDRSQIASMKKKSHDSIYIFIRHIEPSVHGDTPRNQRNKLQITKPNALRTKKNCPSLFGNIYYPAEYSEQGLFQGRYIFGDFRMIIFGTHWYCTNRSCLFFYLFITPL